MTRLNSLLVLTLGPTLLLAQEKPARLDPAGDALPPGAVARLGTVRLRHPDWARSLAVSPDGKTLAAGGDDTIRLWELPSGRPLRKYASYRDAAEPGYHPAPAVAFTAKGEVRALGNRVKGSVFYDPASGEKHKEFAEHSADLLSADGAFAVLVGEGRYGLWDVSGGKEVRPVPSLSWAGGPLPAALSTDGKVLAFGGASIRRVDTATGKDLSGVRPEGGLVSALAVSPDGKLIAAATARRVSGQASAQDVDSEVALWDTGSGKKLRALQTYRRYVCPLAFSPDGKVLATGLGDMTYAAGRTIVLLDTATGKELDRPAGHEAAVRAVAFAAGTDAVVSVCQHGAIRTWDAATGKPARVSTLPRRFTYPTLSPDGKLAAWGVGDRIQLRDLAADKEVRTLESPGATYRTFSADGRYLGVWGESRGENEFRLWETATGKELTACRVRGGWEAIAFAPDASFVVRNVRGKGDEYRLQVVELPGGKEVRSIRLPGTSLVGALAVSPDGKLLASSHHDQWIQVWDLNEGERSRWLAKHPARDRGPRTSLSFAGPVAFSPDGKLLASGGDDATVRLWDVATGKEVRKFTGHEDTVLTLAFSADGKRLASASEDTTVLVWEIAGK